MKSTLTYALLVFLAGSSYGFIVPAVKSANAAGVYPADFLPLQYLVAFAACLAFMLVRRVPLARPLSCVKLAALGLLTGLTSICYYTSVSLLPSAAALTLLFQYVWVSVLIECVLKRELPSLSTVAAVIVVLVGTVFAAGVFEGGVKSLDPLGVAYGAASAVFYALYLYCSGRIGSDQPLELRATMLAAGGLAVTSLANPGCYATALFDPAVWPYAVGMSALGVLVPTTLINVASPHLSAGMVSVMASSELPVGILAAWAIVGDEPSTLVLFGSALVLCGIVVKQFGSDPRDGASSFRGKRRT